TNQLDYSSIIGELPDLSAVTGLQTDALAEQLSAITNQLDYSSIIGELVDAAAAVTLNAIPSAPVGAVEHILAAFEVDGMISAIDWDDEFREAIRQLGGPEGLLAVAQAASDKSAQGSNAEPAIVLLVAATLILIIVGPSLVAVLVLLATELAVTTDFTLRLAAQLGQASPHLQGASYVYFVAQLGAALVRQLNRGDTDD
ncbi:MAG: hypothetical protein GY743_08090, partial [Planctomycetaceae bacterium]|nr:hypothetical protein [Planctomycetaceae bacterium]